MRVLFAFLADFALAHPDGKAYVIGGGVDTVYAAQLPAVHPQISLIAKIEFTPRECGRQHTVEVHGVDADGQPFIQTTTMQFTPQLNAVDATLPTGFQFVVNVLSLQLRASRGVRILRCRRWEGRSVDSVAVLSRPIPGSRQAFRHPGPTRRKPLHNLAGRGARRLVALRRWSEKVCAEPGFRRHQGPHSVTTGPCRWCCRRL